MIDYIIFNRSKETSFFGEKIQLVLGNITVSESIQAQFYSILPKSYGLTEEPVRHEIFVVPIQVARHTISIPKDITFINDMDYYLVLETEERRKYEPLWYNFNLLTKGRTMQIWAPSNWKIRIPFSRQGNKIICEDMVEGDPGRRNPTTSPIIDYGLDTSEEEEEEENEINEAENDI